MIALRQIKAAQLQAEHEVGMGYADAVVVLGARVLPDRPTLELKARLDHACSLWRIHADSKLFVSGGGMGWQDEVRVMTRYLLNKGIPAPSILACQPGATTWQSLCSLASLGQRYGMQKFIVVSSGYHAARIRWIAQQLRLEITISAPSSTPVTRNSAALHKQQWREVIAWLWIRCVVAFRSGIARVSGQRPAWEWTSTDQAVQIATNPLELG